MRFTTALFALAALASTALAHMEMVDPPPFRSKFNKLIDQSTVDFNMASPLKNDGADFPCKGYHKDLDLDPAGATDTTWAAGTPQKVTLDDSAQHNGGSCQLSLSYDGGKTFRVIKSIEGGCVNPSQSKQSFDFNVPADAKPGKVIFAWTWFNHTGNREMYMNCAAVTITGTGTSTLTDRPEIFTANIGGDCSIEEGTDVLFPNPGPDVDVLEGDKALGPPTCKSSGPADPTDSPADDDNDTSSTSSSSTSSASSAVPTDSPADDNDNTSSTSSASSTDPADLYSVAPTGSNAPGSSEEPTKVPVPTRASITSAPTATPTGANGPTYTVKAGDICLDIAKQQGVELATLYKLNPEVNQECTNLRIGQALSLRVRSRIMRDLY